MSFLSQNDPEISRAIDTEKAMESARQYKLLTLSNSDAHTLSDIGKHYNNVILPELSLRVKQEKV